MIDSEFTGLVVSLAIGLALYFLANVLGSITGKRSVQPHLDELDEVSKSCKSALEKIDSARAELHLQNSERASISRKYWKKENQIESRVNNLESDVQEIQKRFGIVDVKIGKVKDLIVSYIEGATSRMRQLAAREDYREIPDELISEIDKIGYTIES